MRRRLLLLLPAAAALATAAVGGSTAAKTPAASVAPAAAERAAITCGRNVTIGVAAPLTGQVASLGQQQMSWAQFFRRQWNRAHRRDLRIVPGDTQLPDTAQAIRAAERLASNERVLAVVGPAGSQEVQVSTAPFKNAGLAFVSGSATRTTLTTDRTRRGFFFRTVPNDDQQGPRVANYVLRTLRARRVVVIDAQNTYSVGLANTVERLLRRAGASVRRESVSEATVTDFSSLVARIPANTQVVYVPWQISAKAQQLGQQLRAAGRRATLFGSDGLFDPDNFRIPGSYISFFPVDLRHRTIQQYARGPGGGQRNLFGLPSYVATQVVALAIDRACRDNQATRAEVRRFIARTRISRRQSLLGFQIRFVSRGRFPLGPGDMQRPADFGIYRITNRGVYVRVS